MQPVTVHCSSCESSFDLDSNTLEKLEKDGFYCPCCGKKLTIVEAPKMRAEAKVLEEEKE